MSGNLKYVTEEISVELAYFEGIVREFIIQFVMKLNSISKRRFKNVGCKFPLLRR